MKADLHVHSEFSKRPSEWILKKLDCPESFTPPTSVYNILRERGMSIVTITDHNSIEGCLEIAHLPGVFISEEVTTYFPEDRCKLHVLVWDIDENIHSDLQEVRGNVYELVQYLNERGITHALAHPLYNINRKLTPNHFEKSLLLFKNFEINGARSDEQNKQLELILSMLDREVIEMLQEKHNLPANHEFPWQKSLTGGSDDHSGLTPGRVCTSVEGTHTVKEFLQGIENHEARVLGQASSPQALAHNLYSIAYQYYTHKFKLVGRAHNDVAMGFLERFLIPGETRQPSWRALVNSYLIHRRSVRGESVGVTRILEMIRRETNELIRDDPQLKEILYSRNGEGRDMEQEWFRFVNTVSNKVLCHFADHVMDCLAGAHLLNLFNSLGSAAGLYTLLAPYFISFSVFSQGRSLADRVFKNFVQPTWTESADCSQVKVAHFTDTFYEINGVTWTLKRQLQHAQSAGRHYTILTCDADNGSALKGVRNFKPIRTYELSVYPEQKLFYPPFLEMLNYCYQEGFTHIHSATPGPLGLVGLAIARILKLPLVGTYHTAIPQYAQYLTEDAGVADIVWSYILWYYDQMDFVYVPSASTAKELTAKGINSDKIRMFPRGVDTEFFHPSHGNGSLDSLCPKENGWRLLYVGRVSKEKNLPLLVNVFKSLLQSTDNVNLVIVGDGPYREEMQQELEGTPAVFTGYLEGEKLASAFASCNLFVFPSTTDTFGNVVLEAQASGLPVIVTDCGGPQENLIRGETGLVAKGDDEESFLEGIRYILDRPEKMKQMGRAARVYAEGRCFETAFEQAWDLYRESGPAEHSELPSIPLPFPEKEAQTA